MNQDQGSWATGDPIALGAGPTESEPSPPPRGRFPPGLANVAPRLRGPPATVFPPWTMPAQLCVAGGSASCSWIFMWGVLLKR